MMEKTGHRAVLAKEAIEGLNIRPDGIYIDGTFGRGGHSREILALLGPSGRLIAFDKDKTAVDFGIKTFGQDPRFSVTQQSFANMEQVLREQELKGKVQGILLDLGVSSPQLDEPDRGFSFMRDGPLDMRMNQNDGLSASDWLNSADEEEIRWVLKELGEERQARKMARVIVEARVKKPITTTGELSALCERWLKPRYLTGKHPATRVFQAIRIWINKELEDLEIGLQQAFDGLGVNGRLVVISFHSLEDRIVKVFINKESTSSLPPKLPVVASALNIRMKKLSSAIKASEEEIRDNPRARSAVLRIAEKIK